MKAHGGQITSLYMNTAGQWKYMWESQGWALVTCIQNHCSPFSEQALKTVEHVPLYTCTVAQGTDTLPAFTSAVIQVLKQHQTSNDQ